MLTFQKYNTVQTLLLQPLSQLLQKCPSQYKCKTITDRDWLKIGISRTIQNEATGRGFLQYFSDMTSEDIGVSTFFEALNSKRRLKLLREFSSTLIDLVDNSDLRKEQDPFLQYDCLSGFDIHAGDGHYHKAAAHDPKKISNKTGKETKYGTQHFYSLNMRTQTLTHLTLANTPKDKKKEHDMHALKRLGHEALRQGAPHGQKVLYVWDRAGIDFVQWQKWKQNSGIYFISREKSNMALNKCGDILYDKEDALNAGVIKDEYVGPSNGNALRRITFQDAETGEIFVFLTTLNSSIPPGLIALLYKYRWDIEKVFDELKNKYHEKKAWGTSATKKEMQALFVTITRNLMLLVEDFLKTENVQDENEIKRRQKRIEKAREKAKAHKRPMPSGYQNLLRLTQMGVKFIRWLRNFFFLKVPLEQAMHAIRRIYGLKT